MEKTISVKEASIILEVSIYRVYQLIREKRIKLYEGKPILDSVHEYRKTRKKAGRPQGIVL